jgi:hypothetical protein
MSLAAPLLSNARINFAALQGYSAEFEETNM